MFSSIGYMICIPFAWLLRVLYNLTSSYGIAIILFTQESLEDSSLGVTEVP